MKNNPTGAMGLPDYPGVGLAVALGPADRLHPRLSGAARQHDRDAALPACCTCGGLAPAPELDEQLRPKWLFGRTTREGCSRAGFTEQGKFADRVRQRLALPGQARLQGPGRAAATCRPAAGSTASAAARTSAASASPARCRRSPTSYMPFMDPDRGGTPRRTSSASPTVRCSATSASATCEKHFEREPEWRQSGRRADERLHAEMVSAVQRQAHRPITVSVGLRAWARSERYSAGSGSRRIAAEAARPPLSASGRAAAPARPARRRFRAQVPRAARVRAGRDGDRRLARAHQARQRPGGATVRLAAGRRSSARTSAS